MRYMIKGGIWKNAEDEVLKAAVMKYGLNQWSRISSLLVRKSAKECKARWYEWLDPSIRKTEWTREEEEKLLHLSKIFPCQWRTIAPILQRTPAQCVEHYEKLLDRAQGKEEQDENDPRRLRPGEIDPNPEAKPARPDEVDMDEDVREMLQEARARLANIRGKKAKRKAREKILEDARRLANLQKKRELKAAGIHFDIPRRQRGMDFNMEIPFQRMVPEGRFKAGVEEEPKVDRFSSAISLQQLEGRSRDDDQKRRKAVDQKRMKKLKDKNMPKALSIINKMSEAGIIHKTELILPEPQVSEAELLSIAKMSAMQSALSGNKPTEATQALIGNYSQREATPMVMRTPMVEDTVLREAQNALAIHNSETPLAGGINAELRTPQAVKPQTAAIPKTPNTLINQLETQQRKDAVFRVPTKRAGTEKRESAGLLRDELSTCVAHYSFVEINVEETDKAWEQTGKGKEAKAELAESKPDTETEQPKKSLKELLSSLPNPQNEYNIELPEGTALPPEEPEAKPAEDMEEAEAKAEAQRHAQDEDEESKMSLPVRRGLPRPFVVAKSPEDVTEVSPPRKMIDEEMYKLVEYDNFMHPGKFIRQPESKPELDAFSKEELLLAKQEIELEAQTEKRPEETAETLEAKWSNTYGKLQYFPGTRRYEQSEGKSIAELVEAKSKMLERYAAHFEKLRREIGKSEGKVGESLDGYVKSEIELRAKCTSLLEKADQDALKKTVFETLRATEERAMRMRETELTSYLKQAESTEEMLQLQYKAALERRASLRAEVAKLYGSQ